LCYFKSFIGAFVTHYQGRVLIALKANRSSSKQPLHWVIVKGFGYNVLNEGTLCMKGKMQFIPIAYCSYSIV